MWTLCRKGETSSGFEEVARCGDLASLRPCQFKRPYEHVHNPALFLLLMILG